MRNGARTHRDRGRVLFVIEPQPEQQGRADLGARRSSSRLETWGLALAGLVLVAFGATFVRALTAAPTSSEHADDGPGDPRGTYAAEQAVQAWHAGRWYPAHVHSASGDRYFITYDDFSISWHEWVTARRLKPR